MQIKIKSVEILTYIYKSTAALRIIARICLVNKIETSFNLFQNHLIHRLFTPARCPHNKRCLRCCSRLFRRVLGAINEQKTQNSTLGAWCKLFTNGITEISGPNIEPRASTNEDAHVFRWLFRVLVSSPIKKKSFQIGFLAKQHVHLYSRWLLRNKDIFKNCLGLMPSPIHWKRVDRSF